MIHTEKSLTGQVYRSWCNTTVGTMNMGSTTCHFRATTCCNYIFLPMQVESVQLLAWKRYLIQQSLQLTSISSTPARYKNYTLYRYLHKHTWSNHHIRSMCVGACTHMIRNPIYVLTTVTEFYFVLFHYKFSFVTFRRDKV